MLWFKESINAAVLAAKRNNSIFLVYIRGNSEDANTKTMDDSWEDVEIERICKDGGIVAIRLDANSHECTQFSEHYPVVCIPSVSFIDGGNGVYIEAIAGAVTPQELAEKLRNIIAAKKGSISNEETTTDSVAQAPASSPEPKPSTTASGQASAEVASTQPESMKAELTAASPAKNNTESVEERAARLRQKMAQLQEKKEKKKKETERQKEVERRETGKSVQDQKRKNQEMVAIREIQERKKEKLEEQKHRKQVREQLARDKLEKKERFEAEKRERHELQEQRSVKKQEELDEEELERKRRRMENSRIQFRLPDGSMFTNVFKATATISEVYEYIKEHITSEDLRSSFTMSTMYPRRSFGSEDMGRTLTELSLVPDASFVVLPGSNAVSNQSSNPLMLILWPFLALWNFLSVLLFGRSRPTPSSNPNEGGSPSRQAGASGNYYGEPGPSTGARPKRRQNAAGSSSRTRQEGNIHRLSQMQEDKDDNNTWNGNSTQQM